MPLCRNFGIANKFSHFGAKTVCLKYDCVKEITFWKSAYLSRYIETAISLTTRYALYILVIRTSRREASTGVLVPLLSVCLSVVVCL